MPGRSQNLAARTVGGIPLTGEQAVGATAIGRSVLVSAAAGSGKTRVLAARCAHLVCDAPQPCGIDELLVVTFTEAAAAEMKSRIKNSLRLRIGTGGPIEPRLARQLALAEYAHVTTMHAFCARLLRENFSIAGIDPVFGILDPDRATQLRDGAAREVIDDGFARDTDGTLTALLDSCDGEDRLIEWMLEIDQLLSSVANPTHWLDESLARLSEAADKPLADSALGRAYLKMIDAELEQLQARCKAAIRDFQAGNWDIYLKTAREIDGLLTGWRALVAAGNLDELSADVIGIKFDRLPSLKNSLPGKELAKSRLDEFRDPIKDPKGALAKLLGSSESQWQAGVAAILPHARALLTLAGGFRERYRQIKEKLNVLDFADLERRALDLLRGDNGVADACRRRYHHVLVDEFQDINEVQDEILRHASREAQLGPGDGANLFCVGDMKQSIYGFRLAGPERFLRRQRLFSSEPTEKQGQLVYLGENFRSRPALLDAINGVFARLMTEQTAGLDYDDSQRLRSPTGRSPAGSSAEPHFSGAPIELHLIAPAAGSDDASAPDDASERDGSADGSGDDDDESPDAPGRIEIEAALLARRIRQIMGMDGGTPTYVADKSSGNLGAMRPVRFGDFAVLLRAAAHRSSHIARVFRNHAIPVFTDSGGEFFDAREILDITHLLHLIDNRRQDIPLAATLRSPLAGLPHADTMLARIRTAYPKSTNIPFHEAVLNYAKEHDDELAAHLRDFLAELDEWRRAALDRPLPALLWDIYEKTGYLAFCEGLDDGRQRVANLLDLHARAVKFSAWSPAGIGGFLDHIDETAKRGEPVRALAAATDPNCVRIMTIHKAKGLEFPIVLIPDLGAKINFSSCNGPMLLDRTAGLGMKVVDTQRQIRYASLPWLVVQDQLKRATIAEELRLLYVAMTRACEHVILVGTSSQTMRESWTQRFTSSSGPLAADVVLGARNRFDWIGPVATASGPGAIFEMNEISAPDEIEKLVDACQPANRVKVDPRLVELEPLGPGTDLAPSARVVIERIEQHYAFGDCTAIPASASVTSMAKSPVAPDDLSTASPLFQEQDVTDLSLDADEPPAPKWPVRLDLPLFAQQERTLAPTEIGTATHLVMERLELARPCRGDDLRQQVAALVTDGRLSKTLADSVDLDGIEWLMSSDVMKRIRSSPTILREVPFALAVEAPTVARPSGPGAAAAIADPLDRIMVRGRIDLLSLAADGTATILDYKTDNVTAQTIDQIAEFYRRQLDLYAQAMTRIARRRVGGLWLAFLRPRILRNVAAPK